MTQQPDAPDGVYCDPQLGCSDRMVGEDLSEEHAWQFSQELRLASHFDGPLNFSVGGNYLHYQTVEDYYVFFNLSRPLSSLPTASGPGRFHDVPPELRRALSPFDRYRRPISLFRSAAGHVSCQFRLRLLRSDGMASAPISIPIRSTSLDGNGHNYFRSENPYRLNSCAGFGEAYYQVTPDLKLTGGLRWTDDQQTFLDIPSWTF